MLLVVHVEAIWGLGHVAPLTSRHGQTKRQVCARRVSAACTAHVPHLSSQRSEDHGKGGPPSKPVVMSCCCRAVGVPRSLP